MAFFWVVTLLGSLAGGLGLVISLFLGSAPQQAASAAISIGFAVVPYCLARSIEKIRSK